MSEGTKSFWGQGVVIKGKEWHTVIRKTRLQKGISPMVGLNEKFIREALKAKATIVCQVLDKGITFRMTATKWKEDSEIYNAPSVKNPGTTFKIYEVKIPMEAFKEAVTQANDIAQSLGKPVPAGQMGLV